MAEDGDQDWGSARRTTNNRMELRAVLEALLANPGPEPLEIISDSKYVIKVFTEWLPAWRARGMRTSSNKPVENVDIIEALEAELARRDVKFTWVKGHAEHPLNAEADSLAVFASKRAKQTIEEEASRARGGSRQS